VNRGNKSLETLRFVKSLGTAAVSVLGNHDVHLLAIAYLNKKTNKNDSLNAILKASDRDELLHWLRHRPLFHYNHHYGLVHAGLPPQWNITQAKKMAICVEKTLQGKHYLTLLKNMYGNNPSIWSENLQGMAQLRFILNCFTRMRFCDKDGRLDFHHKGKPGTQPAHLSPWFEIKPDQKRNLNIIFGHWSTLGFYQNKQYYGIDTGCLWGGELTALKLGLIPEKISIKSTL
jgi:bis(5'-nucleosyl)-tetraphosphatase (symmetrical)